MEKLSYFIKVFVIGFGFLNGFWIAVRFNPETVITNAIAQALNYLAHGSGTLFLVLTFCSIPVSIFSAYTMGGVIGLLAICVAFIGGMLLLTNITFALLLVGAAIIMGMFASHEHQ
jgi:hypothetical protein